MGKCLESRQSDPRGRRRRSVCIVILILEVQVFRIRESAQEVGSKERGGSRNVEIIRKAPSLERNILGVDHVCMQVALQVRVRPITYWRGQQGYDELM